MSLLLALVARGDVVLAECSAPNTTAALVNMAHRILPKIDTSARKMSYAYEDFMFHYLAEDSLIFLCLTDVAAGRIEPYNFLSTVKRDFEVRYENEWMSATHLSLSDFTSTLRKHMTSFGANSARMHRVKGELDEVRGVMVQNLEKVLQRGDKIEQLVDKTESLNQQAFKFKKQSHQLQQDLWWRNCRSNALCYLLVLAILFGAGMTVCGFKFEKCH